MCVCEREMKDLEGRKGGRKEGGLKCGGCLCPGEWGGGVEGGLINKRLFVLLFSCWAAGGEESEDACMHACMEGWGERCRVMWMWMWMRIGEEGGMLIFLRRLRGGGGCV